MSRDAVVLTIVISAILLVSAKHELLRVYIGGFFRFRKQRTSIQFAIDILGVVVATGDRYPHHENIIGITINDAVAAVVDVVSLKCSQRLGFGLVDFGREIDFEVLVVVGGSVDVDNVCSFHIGSLLFGCHVVCHIALGV